MNGGEGPRPAATPSPTGALPSPTGALPSTAATQALDEALSLWIVAASTAEAAGRRAQRTATLDLLRAVRRVALGLETIARLEQDHHTIERMLATAAASAAGSVERLDQRRAALDQLLDAAERTLGPAGAVPGQSPTTIHSRPTGLRRATYEAASAARHQALTARAELNAARRASAETLRRLHEAIARHDRAGKILGALHDAFAVMRTDAQAALDTAVRAGAELDASAGLYEHAQLAVVDVRRDVLPPPSGLPLRPPANVAPIPLVAA